MCHSVLVLLVALGMMAVAVTGCDVKVVMDCSSWNYQPATCTVNGGHASGIIRVIRQHSRSTCTLNRSFGYENGQIWVNSGCRATFEVCSCANLKEVDCDSWDFRFQSCPVPGFVTYVQLKEKRSRSDCILDQSYGSSQASIWVDNGCRGRFYVCHA